MPDEAYASFREGLSGELASKHDDHRRIPLPVLSAVRELAAPPKFLVEALR